MCPWSRASMCAVFCWKKKTLIFGHLNWFLLHCSLKCSPLFWDSFIKAILITPSLFRLTTVMPRQGQAPTFSHYYTSYQWYRIFSDGFPCSSYASEIERLRGRKICGLIFFNLASVILTVAEPGCWSTHYKLGVVRFSSVFIENKAVWSWQIPSWIWYGVCPYQTRYPRGALRKDKDYLLYVNFIIANLYANNT